MLRQGLPHKERTKTGRQLAEPPNKGINSWEWHGVTRGVGKFPRLRRVSRGRSMQRLGAAAFSVLQVPHLLECLAVQIRSTDERYP